MGNKKKLAAFFRKEAAKLAPETYKAYHKYSTVQYHKDGDQAYPVYGEIGTHEVNHARRLKRIYEKEGLDGVTKYFEARGFRLEKKEDGQPEDNSSIKE